MTSSSLEHDELPSIKSNNKSQLNHPILPIEGADSAISQDSQMSRERDDSNSTPDSMMDVFPEDFYETLPEEDKTLVNILQSASCEEKNYTSDKDQQVPRAEENFASNNDQQSVPYGKKNYTSNDSHLVSSPLIFSNGKNENEEPKDEGSTSSKEYRYDQTITEKDTANKRLSRAEEKRLLKNSNRLHACIEKKLKKISKWKTQVNASLKRMNNIQKLLIKNQRSRNSQKITEIPWNAEKKMHRSDFTIHQQLTLVNGRALPMSAGNTSSHAITQKMPVQEKELPFVLENPERSILNLRTNCGFNTVILCLMHCLSRLHQNIAEWISSPGSENSQNQSDVVTSELVKLCIGETRDVTILRQALYPNRSLNENCDASEVLEHLVENVPQLQQLFQFDHIFMCYCSSCGEESYKKTPHSQFRVECDGTTTDFSTLLEKSKKNFHEPRCPKCGFKDVEYLNDFDASKTKILAIQLPIHNGRSLDQLKFTSRPEVLNIFRKKWRLKAAPEFEGEDPYGHYTTWIENSPGWIHSNDVTKTCTEEVMFKENCINIPILFYVKSTGEEEPLPPQSVRENSAAAFLGTDLKELHTNANINDKILQADSRFNKETNSNKWAAKASNAVDPNNSPRIVPGYDSTVIFGIGDDVKNQEDLEDTEVFHPHYKTTCTTTSDNRKRSSTQITPHTNKKIKERDEETSPSFYKISTSKQQYIVRNLVVTPPILQDIDYNDCGSNGNGSSQKTTEDLPCSSRFQLNYVRHIYKNDIAALPASRTSERNNPEYNTVAIMDKSECTEEEGAQNDTSEISKMMLKTAKDKIKEANRLPEEIEINFTETDPTKIIEKLMPAIGSLYAYSLTMRKGPGRREGTLKKEGASDSITRIRRETNRRSKDNKFKSKKRQQNDQIKTTNLKHDKYIEELNSTYNMLRQKPAAQNGYIRKCIEKLKNEREESVDIKKVWGTEDVKAFFDKHPDKESRLQVGQYELRTRLLEAIRNKLQSTEESVMNEELSPMSTTRHENGTNRSTNAYQTNPVLAENPSHGSDNPAVLLNIRGSSINQATEKTVHVAPSSSKNPDTMISEHSIDNHCDVYHQKNSQEESFNGYNNSN